MTRMLRSLLRARREKKPCTLAVHLHLRLGERAKADEDIVSPHFIDAFWVQCLVGKFYSDPQTTSDKNLADLPFSPFLTPCQILATENQLTGSSLARGGPSGPLWRVLKQVRSLYVLHSYRFVS